MTFAVTANYEDAVGKATVGSVTFIPLTPDGHTREPQTFALTNGALSAVLEAGPYRVTENWVNGRLFNFVLAADVDLNTVAPIGAYEGLDVLKGAQGIEGPQGPVGPPGPEGPIGVPTRLGEAAVRLSNWDQAVTNGYYWSDGAGAPTTGLWLGHVVAYSTQWVTQTVWDITSNTEALPKVYRRERNGGVWGPWEKTVGTQAEADSRYGYRGTGSPVGSVSAPVGAKYIDTAATNGAIEWMSTAPGTSGWSVSYGDTGWRNVTGLLINGFSATGQVLLKRNGATVTMRVSALVSSAATSDSIMKTIEGFRSGKAQGWHSVVGGALLREQGGEWQLVPRTTTYFNLIWQTDDAWPVTLPGIVG